MKGFRSGDILTSPLFVKLFALVLIGFAFFYLGKHWSESDGFDQLLYFSRQTDLPSIDPSPNVSKNFDISSLITPHDSQTAPVADRSLPPSPADPPPASPPPASKPPPLPPPPPPPISLLGIVDENGTMREDFVLDGYDSDLASDTFGDENDNSSPASVGSNSGGRFKLKKFPICPNSMREYIPCLDNVEAIQKLKSTEKGEKFERHCPEQGKGLDCLVPAPKDYKQPIPWPRSRDEIWFNNVPHPRLVEDKGGQNWITRVKDKFKFPGGGTQFIHGADQYIDQISQMVPDIAFGRRTRVVLDVGCGVASFGAFLLSRKVAPLSIAPKDVHENQIQFALERGVPAMIAAFATHRLLYPSQAFDLIHCSRCRINWTRDDGILLLEVNRMLRAGGYFAWAAQPVYKHEEAQQEAWKEMEDLTNRMCWKLVNKDGYLAIWKKPLDNNCYLSRDAGIRPPLCESDDDPDNVWYVDLKPCITRLPENRLGANLMKWPERLHYPPDRLQTVEMDAYMAKKELFKAESKFWNDIVGSYIRAYHWKKLRLRNVMDMRASFGGFAVAIIDLDINSWVMNVVPTSGHNTLPVIYDRGLLGVLHDWCEPFDTYPRTYDLLHASGLFSIEQKRCNITSILLEMNRILRPGGRAYIRDSKSVIEDIYGITNAMGWRSTVQDTSEGPYASRRVLRCDKP
ncbi:probable methyltransferase PMT11 [Aristolochia californica]|uniref:probable methyltransferase PMT11 n=1 Tax=Aristolochia californica TaxID=171875 RepID=UPI0035E2A2A4